jgi:hypothetical protein
MRLMIAASAILVATAALAAEGDGPAGKKRSLDQMVCKSISLSGSMLDRKRVCMTRLKWEEQRRKDRDWIDRAQTTHVGNKGG